MKMNGQLKGRARSKDEYINSIDINFENAAITTRIKKAFQHLIDITDSSETF